MGLSASAVGDLEYLADPEWLHAVKLIENHARSGHPQLVANSSLPGLLTLHEPPILVHVALDPRHLELVVVRVLSDAA